MAQPVERAGRISVVIATRNRRAELLHTLERLTGLPERPPVCVVDNGSDDGTAAAVATAFPGVRLVRLERNLGACARNIGVEAAGTPYVAFSDDDAWWEPGALARAAEVCDRHPRLGALVACIRHGDSGELDPVSGKMASAPLGRPPGLPGPLVVGFPACAAVVRRDAFLAAGGFDELLFFGGEESLLALDLAADGWDVAYVDDVGVRHRPSRRREPAPARWALHRRNDLLVCWMRLPLAVAVGRTGRLAWEATHNRAAATALLGLAHRLPRALARRRPVPAAVAHRLRVLGELR